MAGEIPPSTIRLEGRTAHKAQNVTALLARNEYVGHRVARGASPGRHVPGLPNTVAQGQRSSPLGIRSVPA
jgi:hypothetical protein